MCFSHDEYSDVWIEKHPVAKKRHICKECGLPIHPGEQYKSIFSVFEGDARSIRICAICEWFLERIANHEREQGCSGGEAYPPIGQLQEALDTNEFSERGYACLIGMVPIQRNRHSEKFCYTDYTYEEGQN